MQTASIQKKLSIVQNLIDEIFTEMDATKKIRKQKVSEKKMLEIKCNASIENWATKRMNRKIKQTK